MNVENIKRIIQSKCRFYDGETTPSYERGTREYACWLYEELACNAHSDRHKTMEAYPNCTTDDDIANRIISDLLNRLFLKDPSLKEMYYKKTILKPIAMP